MGREKALSDVRLRAPIVPRKFIHTAGNFREHEDESKRVGWSHEIAPWIVFFQNVDAIIGPDEPIVYPEQLTEELDYELELAVVIAKSGKWFGSEEAADYIGGYVIFNDITARDIQRREMRSGAISCSKATASRRRRASSSELAARRRQARPRPGADGRGGTGRARRPGAGQRALPDELLGDEGLRRGRLPPRRPARADHDRAVGRGRGR